MDAVLACPDSEHFCKSIGAVTRFDYADVQYTQLVHHSDCQNTVHFSLATVMTDVFRKNWIMSQANWLKLWEYLWIEHVKDWGVTFWPKRIGQIFPTLWSGHKIWPNLWPNSWPLHTVGNSRLILLCQNVTCRFLICSISTNILTVLAHFLAIIIQFFWKISVMTVANTWTFEPVSILRIWFWQILSANQSWP